MARYKFSLNFLKNPTTPTAHNVADNYFINYERNECFLLLVINEAN
jgi:hypothetical protein